MVTGRHYIRHHLLVGAAILGAALTLALYQGASWYQIYQSYAHPQALLRAPFEVDGTRTVVTVFDEASEAGIRIGDHVLSLGGVPLNSQSQYRSLLLHSTPGLNLKVGLAVPGSGPARQLAVHLRNTTSRTSDQSDWILVAVTFFFLPAVCLCLGLGVVCTKPESAGAWVFFALMTSFSQVYHFAGWEGRAAAFVILFRTLAASTLGVSLSLVMIYVPRRVSWDKQQPWLKFVWLGPQMVLAGWNLLERGMEQVSFAAASWLQPHLAQGRNLLGLSILLTSAALIVALAVRRPFGLSADDRRRQRIVLVGVLIAFAPIGLLTAHGIVRDVDPLSNVPRWTVLLALLSLNALPLSLAYVLLAHRVLGLRSLALQGLMTSRGFAGRNAHLLLLVGSLGCFLGLAASRRTSLPVTFVFALGAVLFLILSTLSGRSTTWLKARLFPESTRTERLLLELEDDTVRGMDALLERITARLSEAFQVPVIAWIEESGAFVPVATAGGGLINAVRLPADCSISQRLREIGEPQEIYFDGSQSWIEELPSVEREFLAATGSTLLVPLVRHLRLTGILSLGSKSSEEPYTSAEIALLRRLATHASLSVENSLLLSSLAAEVAIRERQSIEQQAAQEANAAKSDFLARMSHELRTPLNAIIGYSELLQEIAEEESLAEFGNDLGKILSAGKHLLQLINSILDISKIEAGRMELFMERCNVEALMREVVDIVQPLMSKNGNRLVLETSEQLGVVQADTTKLRQSLFNLLSNASKFTSKGTIWLGARRVRREDEEWVELTVRDTGIGISNKNMERLFGTFMQADASISRDYGGTGLGLAISRHFCRMMGGDITVSSVVGEGSTFQIELPVHHLDATSGSETMPHKEGMTSLLVIDDDPRVHEIVRRFLVNQPFHIYSAYSGKEGLEKARLLQPQIMTLDVLMPDVEGWSVLAEMRSDPQLCRIPVVMLTIVDDQRTGFALGSNGYLLKPITKGALTTALNDVLGLGGGQSSILVIDDDAHGRTLLRNLLSHQGCTVLEAANGSEGIEQLAKGRPDLILLDLIMPEMDGFSFLAELRSRTAYADVPVVVMTSKDLTLAERGLLDRQSSVVLKKNELDEEQFISELYRHRTHLERPIGRAS